MLRVISTQYTSDPDRLWFSDDSHDLFVWLDENRKPIAFQFSYDKHSNEHAIHWSKDRGFGHDRIDSGEPADGSYKMTPIMVPDGEFDSDKIAQRFRAISKTIDSGIADFIYQALLSYKD